MSSTRTGAFPIGFRSWGKGWQKSVSDTIAFAKGNGFECIDTGPMDAGEWRMITAAGLRIGSVDLVKWPELAASQPGVQAEAVDENIRLVRSALPFGVRNFFAVARPQEANARRKDNFERVVDGYGRLCEAIAPLGARVILEGWPGHDAASIGCTPADCRALLKEIPRGCGINFDPSHLVRMGIDPVRFLEEFAPRVFHVHGKDTEIMEEDLYEHGHLQEATFAARHGYGGFSWRYTIPGHGRARWGKLLSQLKAAGYDGIISIELEDEDFNGTEDGEKRGLIAGRTFLEDA